MIPYILRSQNKLSAVQLQGCELENYVTDLDQQRLIAILANPSETMSIECKGWLDISEKRDKATLAKAAIALANNGGGTIVLGVGKNKSDSGKLTCLPKPAGFQIYSSDAIDSAINTYADPDINFKLSFASHPDSGEEYPFIEIPGGMLQPVFAKKSFDGVIEKYACYTRKPGPKSAKPSSPQEWRDLFGRCVRANRDSMYDAIRAIVLGNPETLTTQVTDSRTLKDYVTGSHKRWQELVEKLPTDDQARFPYGYFEVAFSILGIEQSASLRVLRDMLRNGPAATRGWPPFIALSREPYIENAIGGAIECWLGAPEGEKIFRDAYFLPFWRAHPDGYFYQIEGFLEPKQFQSIPPGKSHYPEFTIQRLAHFLLHARDLARRFDEDTNILLACRFTGLKDKILMGTPGRPLFRQYRCHDEQYSFETQVSQVQIRDNLVEIIQQQLCQLYELFSFFELKQAFVANCLNELGT